MGNIKEKIMKKKKIVFPIIGVIIVLVIILIVKSIIDFNSPKIVLKDNKIVCMEKGKMKIDELVNIDNKTYYFDKNGSQVVNRMIDVAGIGTAYFDKNGHMSKDKISTIDGEDYYFDMNGAMQVGIFEYNGNLSYTKENGGLIYNGIVADTPHNKFINGLNADKSVGLKELSGLYFYNNLDNIGEKCIRHEDCSGKIAYMQDNGYLIAGCVYNIDGKDYIFNQYGVGDIDKNKIASKKTIKEYSRDTSIDDIDTICFGNMPQDSKDGSESELIEWVILEKSGNSLYLLSKYIIDKAVNNTNEYLKNGFYNSYFTEEERNCIIKDDIEGKPMIDLMNKDNFAYYFDANVDPNADREANIKAQANCTNYAKANGSDVNYKLNGTWYHEDFFWDVIKTTEKYDILVDSQGIIQGENDENVGLRPTITIDLSKYSNLDIKTKVMTKNNNVNSSERDLSSRITNDIKNAKIVSDYYVDNTIEEMDTVKFGKYPQRDIEGKKMEDIEWLVLEKNEDSALLFSKYVLDYGREYYDIMDNKKDASLYLPDGMLLPLRDFLNNIFLKRAFNDEEKELLLPCNHSNVTTNDLVTLPNYEDMLKAFNGFKDEYEHKGIKEIITEYVKNKQLDNGTTVLSNFKLVGSSIYTAGWGYNNIKPEIPFVSSTYYRPIIRVKLKK